MNRILLQPAYILHHRPYRNTSALLEVLTRDYGRLGLVAKGVKGKSGAGRRGILQPFIHLLISYSSRQDLGTLIAAEPAGGSTSLSGQTLYSAFYLNELLMRLLHRGDAHEQLFLDYNDAVNQLQQQAEYEPVLRRFETRLLQELGYGLQLETDTQQDPINTHTHYYYDPLRGPVPAEAAKTNGLPLVSGACLKALAGADFTDPGHWPEMKILMRNIIAHHLNGKPLHSRELFQPSIRATKSP
jgi:DNA repair protein RecO (recombination protein O)